MLEIWTDGSSGGGVSTGGWGFITNDGRLSRFGGAYETTNQRMELTAAGKRLRAVLQDPFYEQLKEVVLVSDSRYVLDGLEKQWYRKWEANGWKTSSKSPVKNAELWCALMALVTTCEERHIKLTFKWVKGHSGEELNEKADALARRGKEHLKELALLKEEATN